MDIGLRGNRMLEDAGVNFAASQTIAKPLFLLKFENQVVFTSSRAGLQTLKAAHLNN